MTVQGIATQPMFLLYIDEKPKTLIPGKDVEHALEQFRAARLGAAPAKLRAVSVDDAPIDDLARVALLAVVGMLTVILQAMSRAQAH